MKYKVTTEYKNGQTETETATGYGRALGVATVQQTKAQVATVIEPLPETVDEWIEFLTSSAREVLETAKNLPAVHGHDYCDAVEINGALMLAVRVLKGEDR